jgi:hypothetical protein
VRSQRRGTGGCTLSTSTRLDTRKLADKLVAIIRRPA